MKMVKSLLLGSAAGLVAVAGAQAADLPVKAKPVQYVKICSLYGAGFYYVPGTELCLKVGGYVRYEAAYGVNSDAGNKSLFGNVNNRTTSDLAYRHKGAVTLDGRSQTEYGTARAYLSVGLSGTNIGAGNNTFDANRAFIQWAGFTFGQATSFFDFYSNAQSSFLGPINSSDTGDPGHGVFAYTAQFGNGLSATLSAETRRMTQIYGQGSTIGSLVGGTTVTATGYGGWSVPDLVANLRVDQAWGSAQVMGALHQVNATYYGASEAAAAGLGPSYKWGFVVGAGIKVNVPMIGQGDYFQAQVTYSQGGTRYLFQGNPANPYSREGGTAAFGVMTDGVFGGTTAATFSSIELTTGWGVNAAYDHMWNRSWKTSLYGGYAAISYNSAANAMLCVAEGFGAGSGITAVATAGCNNDWNIWFLGSRTQWTISQGFYMGLDVMYQNLNSAELPAGATTAAFNPTGARAVPAGVTAGDMDAWTVKFRVNKTFAP